MVCGLKGKVIAIPAAMTATGSAVAKLVAAEQGELVLGAATAAQLKSAEALVPSEDLAYPVQVNLERPKSVDEFFKIAIGQFGHVDAIVLETLKPATQSALTERFIGHGARRLLHCLDAALKYCAGDLHIINVSPVAGRYAIPVASAFLGAKLATSKPATACAPPSLRMSVISPFDRATTEDGALARMILHVLREPRAPDVSETILWRQPAHPVRRSKAAIQRSKIMMPV
jgi:NADP-dependent 3-hydroxy acid dehydrogenase YdfG